MAIKIVTDSTADLPEELVKELDITIVPVYVRFGQEVFRDGIDITQDEVYNRIISEGAMATTSQPSPDDFRQVYDELLADGHQIVSIHLSGRLSGTYNSAVAGRDLSYQKNKITVIDSLSLSMGLGFGVLASARMAKAKIDLDKIIATAAEIASVTRIVAVFDTLKYVLKSGRLGAAKALIGGILSVKPILTLKDGVLWPSGIARTRSKAIDSLAEIVRKTPSVDEAAVVYSTTADEALAFKERLSDILDSSKIHLSRLGPALGAHGGPGTLILALHQDFSKN